MSKASLVCDTPLLLYLGRIGQAELLPALFGPIYVPEVVILELAAGALLRPDTLDPLSLGWVRPVKVTAAELATLPQNRLGRGEQAVLAYGYAQKVSYVGLDDRQARLLAEALGLQTTGLIGVLLRAKRGKLIPSVRELLDSVRLEGFRIDDELYLEALRLAGEESSQ
ncbi:MAG: DUF3368 domain-containing protein [Anaerolineae bacterium]